MKPLFLSLLLVMIIHTSVYSITLVKSGEPVAKIVVSEKAVQAEITAAQELAAYVFKISGARLSIIKSNSLPSGETIIVGRHPETIRLVGTDLNENKLGFDGVILKAFPGKLILVGMNEKATQYAVVEFLKRIGCRFFLPHPDGEVIPLRKNISIKQMNILHKPSFVHREFWNNGDVQATLAHPEWYSEWAIHTFQGGVKLEQGHNYFRIVPVSMFTEHPEYFPLVRTPDGTMQRVNTGNAESTQRCISNPDVVKLAADAAITLFDEDKDLQSFSLTPDDGTGWCECDACKAMDSPDPNVGLAWRVMKFNNQVAEIVSKKYPNKWLFYYADYLNIPGPPLGMKADPMIMAGLVNTYDTCHSIFDKTSALNQKYLKRLDFWEKNSSNQFVYEWYQYSNLPTPFVYAVAERIAYYHKIGVKGYSGEIIGRSPVNDLAMYVASQMLWDASQDPNKIIKEFFKLYFSECAKQMEEYYRILHETTYYSKKPGGFHEDRDWTPDIISRLHNKLKQAKAIAVRDVVKRRLDREQISLDVIDYVATAYSCADLWKKGDSAARDTGRIAADKAIALLSAISDEDIYAEAMVIEQIKLLKRTILDSDTPISSVSARLQRGWDDNITFGGLWKDYEEIGKVPSFWKFKTDPDAAGRKNGWFKSDFDDSSWDNIQIAEFWEAQGYDGYNGFGWYRTKLDIPSSATGRKIILYFGAADENAVVWVNGKLAGKSEGDPNLLWDKMFPIDITDFVTSGSACSIAVEVHDGGGAGGLWKNIKLVSPKG